MWDVGQLLELQLQCNLRIQLLDSNSMTSVTSNLSLISRRGRFRSQLQRQPITRHFHPDCVCTHRNIKTDALQNNHFVDVAKTDDVACDDTP